MTAAIGLKRFAIAAGAFIAALFVILMVFPFFVPAATVRDAVRWRSMRLPGLNRRSVATFLSRCFRTRR